MLFLDSAKKNVHSNFAHSSIPPPVSSDDTSAVLLSAKAELLSRTFAINSSLDDSRATPTSPPSNLFMPYIVISALSEFKTKNLHSAFVNYISSL